MRDLARGLFDQMKRRSLSGVRRSDQENETGDLRSDLAIVVAALGDDVGSVVVIGTAALVLSGLEGNAGDIDLMVDEARLAAVLERCEAAGMPTVPDSRGGDVVVTRLAPHPQMSRGVDLYQTVSGWFAFADVLAHSHRIVLTGDSSIAVADAADVTALMRAASRTKDTERLRRLFPPSEPPVR